MTERKYSITAVYPGFRYQLYAQYFALQEMGFQVDHLRLYSQKDNKIYPVSIPGTKETEEFENILLQIRSYSLESAPPVNIEKCKHCIYKELCDVNPIEDPS